MQSNKVKGKGTALMTINVSRVLYIFNGTYMIL